MQDSKDLPKEHSAGGIVVRKEDDKIYVALISDGGLEKVLPKGHIEKDEEIEAAAKREIEEEAGFSDLVTLADLGIKERLAFNKKYIVIQHFLLFKTNQKEGNPTDKSEIYAPPQWFEIENLPEMYWPEQKELIQENIDLIRRLA